MRVLEITSELDGGGVDRLLYEYCSRLVDVINFDFVVTSKNKGILEYPLEKLGCRIYHVSQYREGVRKHIDEMNAILKNQHYDVVHDNSGYKAFWNLYIAKKNKVKTRIAHSHQAFVPEKKKTYIKRKLITPLTKMYATRLIGCGSDAAKWMWGSIDKSSVLPNAIDAKQFSFSQHMRDKLRKELSIEDKFVIGNVARFSEQKNHEFLIKMFDRLVKYREDAVLLLIGRGELEHKIKKMVENLNLQDKVIFLGVREDVSDLYNAMDVFCLPSRYEGLPVTLVEIQANGLPSFVSSCVTKEILISNNMEYLDITQPNDWAKRLIRFYPQRGENVIINTSYDIDLAAKKLLNLYNFK